LDPQYQPWRTQCIFQTETQRQRHFRLLFGNEEANSFGRKTAEIYFSNKQIIFLWDGFDELPGVCADSVIDIVKNLASEGYSQWLSARSDLRESLESAFNRLNFNTVQSARPVVLYLEISKREIRPH
jgi:hypothetical protein